MSLQGNLGPLCLAGGSVNAADTVENSLVAPQKIKHRLSV